MSRTEDLQAFYARILALEAELEAATEQLEAFGFRVVFDDAPPPPPPPLPPARHHWSPNPKSLFRGVCWCPDSRKWKALMSKSKAFPRGKYLGLYLSEEDAALAWDNFAKEQGLVKKKLNFP
jgi:hypothetical protein